MAQLHFNISIDMRTFAGYDYSVQSSSGGGGSSNGSEDDVTFNSGFYDIIKGSGWTGFNGLFPGGGTVTSWEFGLREVTLVPTDPFHPIIHQTAYWTFDGFSMPSNDLAAGAEGNGATLAAAMEGWLSGNDTIFGSAYNDYLLGYGGDDTIDGGKGADTMVGGTGNDTYFVDNSGDKIVESFSQGTDLVKSSVTYALPANVENITLTGSAAINATGNGLANMINGNAAANRLSGMGGNDTIHGGAGNDTLIGGAGNDNLYGGTGQDQFLFNTALSATTNVDHIQDFSVADDTIVLDQSIFSQISPLGTLDLPEFFTGTAAHDADDRIIYNSTTGNIYYDPDGNGPEAQVLFAHVTAGLALTNADFLIVA